MKLFGSTKSGARLAKNRPAYAAASTYHSTPATTAAVKPKSNKTLARVAVILSICLFLECTYFFLAYTQLPAVKNLRKTFIGTAMETMTFRWAATLTVPHYKLEEEYAAPIKESSIEGEKNVSKWGNTTVTDKETGEVTTNQVTVQIAVIEEDDPEEEAEETFYELFYEVDRDSLQEYLDDHPEALDDGWANLHIDESGLDENGTSIETIYGDQILAIDVPNKILVVRIKGSKNGTGYVGALAIGKDPAQLYVRPSSKLWREGETVAQIASANNGVLAMTGSAFIDPDGNGNGGELAGYAMYDGVGDGYGHMGRGYKRLELHEDNLMYITNAPTDVSPGTTDAVEFGPALIVDGEIVVDANCGYTGIQPRACIGQSDKYAVMMLIIEGRQSHSLGTDVIECAEIMSKYGCMQAMNLDGGTSAILWYNGETITKCSNQRLPDGRPLPTAFVYETIR